MIRLHAFVWLVWALIVFSGSAAGGTASTSFDWTVTGDGGGISLVNGSFEEPVVTANDGSHQLYTGSEAPGWLITGDVDIMRDRFEAADGSQAMDLNGSNAGSVSQTLTGLTVGTTYQLSVQWARHPSGSGARSADVIVNGEVVGSLKTSKKLPPYLTSSFDFAPAPDGSAEIAFVSTSLNTWDGIIIDDVQLSVATGNHAPSISSIAAQMNAEGDTVSLQVNASDPDGDTLTYSATGLPAGLTIDSSTGLISGTLSTGSQGTYSVIVTVDDGNGGTVPQDDTSDPDGDTSDPDGDTSDPDGDTSTDSPNTSDGTETDEGQPGDDSGGSSEPESDGVVSFTLVDASSDVEIGSLADGTTIDTRLHPEINIRANTEGDVGSVSFSLTGAESYTKTENLVPYALFGDSSGDYHIWSPTDGNYVLSATPDVGDLRQISFTVISSEANNAPVADDLSIVTEEDQSVSMTLSATDADGDSLSYAVASGPNNGALSGTAPSLTYQPDSGYTGSDSFTFSVSDGNGESDTGTVSINVAAVEENTTGVVSFTLVDASSDIDIGALADGATIDTTLHPEINIRANTEGAVDSVSFSLTGAENYTKTENLVPYALFGDSSGDYHIWRPGNGDYVLSATPDVGDSRQISFTVVSSEVNNAPAADDLSVATEEDQSVSMTLSGTDADGDSLSYAVATGPSNGALSGTAPSLTYQPDSGYTGSDSFTFSVSDGNGGSDTGIVSISVSSVGGKARPGSTGLTQVEDPDGRTCGEGPINPTPYTDSIGLINPTGDEIGGLTGVYSKRVSRDQATVIVETAAQLKSAIGNANAGDVVWLRSGSIIDLDEVQLPIHVPGGVTIAGDRNDATGSRGPLVHLDNYPKSGTNYVFYARGDKVRFTGFRLQGPLYLGNDADDVGVAIHLDSSSNSSEVDNMELYGWTWAGVGVRDSKRAYVHHSYMHTSNSYNGFHYGVVLIGDADVLVEANVFDKHRHAVAGSGSPGQSYEARYNIALSEHAHHVFDMHGPNTAGDQIYIHHNEVRVPRDTYITGVMIRGVPGSCAWISHNWFYDVEDRAIAQRADGTLLRGDDTFIDMVDFDNQYGPPQ